MRKNAHLANHRAKEPVVGLLSLLQTRRFLPLFAVQFLGALNDNFFKQSLIILITYRLGSQSSLDTASLTAIAGATLILPFILFSSMAGNIADKYDKAAVIQQLKLLECLIMTLAGIALFSQQLVFLYIVLFLLGTQSAFFGPLKYSTVPFLLEDKELIAGNALIEAGTFIAILLGSIIGGLLIQSEHGFLLPTGGMLLVATIGYGFAKAIPHVAPQRPRLSINWNIFSGSWQILHHAWGNTMVREAMFVLCWFWAVASVILSLLSVIASEVTYADETVATFFLALFSVAIAVGSLMTNRLTKGVVDLRFAVYGIIVVSVTCCLLCISLPFLQMDKSGDLLNLVTFAQQPKSYLLVAILFVMGFAVGPYITPVYAVIQHAADDANKGSTIAASNIINSLAILISAIIVIILRDVIGLSIGFVLLLFGLANLVALYHVWRANPKKQ